jgi:hypothetical protein
MPGRTAQMPLALDVKLGRLCRLNKHLLMPCAKHTDLVFVPLILRESLIIPTGGRQRGPSRSSRLQTSYQSRPCPTHLLASALDFRGVCVLV